MSSDMARHRAETTGLLWVLPSLLIPLAIAASAWTSHVASEGDHVAPNVRFAGLDVSEMTPDAVAEVVGDREAAFLRTPVTIDLGERSVTMTAEDIGFDYQYDETVAAAISARHGEGPWGEFVAWMTTPFNTVSIADRFALDGAVARQRLLQDDLVISFPVEPKLTSDGDGLALIPGREGMGIDVDETMASLAVAGIDQGPVVVEASRVVLDPTVTDEAARALTDQLSAKTEQGILTVIGDKSARITASQVRRHLRSSVTDGIMTITIDIGAFQEELERAFPEPVGPFSPPEFQVVDGVVQLTSSGEPPPVCCSRESVAAAARELLNGGSAFYALEPRPDDDEEVVAWADGTQVTEVVAQFTTEHPCCESRVTNIQRIADLLTGVYLVPNESLSLNEFIGPRTRENGFVAAGAIRHGHMVEEIGGGVSQFVTTLFNAAYFAGLDLDEYQSHSIYFSRYPFGREATLSAPGPDLVITNTTDYPVLIWPSYDDHSITVTLYSTEHLEVEELEQRITRRRLCTHVETDRQRTYPDGRIVVDTIEANYRPAEGIDCSGRAIPEP
jgi:vancomycin resistance protein YoaR